MQKKGKRNTAGIGVLAAVLVICELASLLVLSGRIVSYTEAKFVNVMPLFAENAPVAAIPVETSDSSEDVSSESTSAPSEETTSSEASVGSTEKHPVFRMEAEAEIFRLSYDNESGQTTVIGAGSSDKLIAPGTANLYQFTLKNPGDASLEYTLTMEAYVTGTDLKFPVNVRLWDHTNKYLIGSADGKADVLELNTVEESAELGAGRYAVYNLEWEWPFEWGDDEYDTMLGNLAVEEDLVLHIVIRTNAAYDEDPDDPNSGLIDPPQTGDEASIILLALLCGGSFTGLCVTLFAYIRSGRKEKQVPLT